MQTVQELKEILAWQLEAGVDECIGMEAVDKFVPPPALSQPTEAPVQEARPQRHAAPITNGTFTPPSVAVAKAKEIAERVTSIEELQQEVAAFDGCLLKRTATKTVFADGNLDADVMVIDEAPGEHEDLSGAPFSGDRGKMLDNMMASIELSRAESLYLANALFWRPPGNRTPSAEEVAICAPLVKKHIALKNPKLLVLAGGMASGVLETKNSVSKLRGKFHEYQNEYLEQPIKAVVIYHPAYLLRQPSRKAQAWKDMLMIQGFLENN